MAYVTLSQCKSLLNISSNVYDSPLTLLINVASTALNKYIGKTIEQTDNVDMILIQTDQSRYYPNNTPIISINNVQTIVSTINVTSTNNTMLNITNDSLITSNNIYVLANYSNVTNLMTQVLIDNTNLSSSIIVDIAAVDLSPVSIGIDANQTIQLLGFNQYSAYTYLYNSNYLNVISGKYRIKYTSGYAVIPDDLQYVCSRVVQDMLNIQNLTVNPNIKSESITNYSYTNADVDLRSIVSNYKGILDEYKNPVLFGSADISTFGSDNTYINYWGI